MNFVVVLSVGIKRIDYLCIFCTGNLKFTKFTEKQTKKKGYNFRGRQSTSASFRQGIDSKKKDLASRGGTNSFLLDQTPFQKGFGV